MNNQKFSWWLTFSTWYGSYSWWSLSKMQMSNDNFKTGRNFFFSCFCCTLSKSTYVLNLDSCTPVCMGGFFDRYINELVICFLFAWSQINVYFLDSSHINWHEPFCIAQFREVRGYNSFILSKFTNFWCYFLVKRKQK